MRVFNRALLAGGVGFALSGLAACGGSGAGLLSGDQASTLNNQLDQVSSALQSHNCGAVESASVSLANAIANLPPTVNAALKRDLGGGAEQVSALATRECRQAPAGPTSPSTTSTATTTTAPATTTTTQPTTHTTPTSTSTTPATTPTGTGTNPGPSGGGGLSGSGGGGNGNGNGNGNG